jgi:hypothetical protein
VPCGSWPSLTPERCCPDGQCRPVLPATSAATEACCGDVRRLPHSQLPRGGLLADTA